LRQSVQLVLLKADGVGRGLTEHGERHLPDEAEQVLARLSVASQSPPICRPVCPS
jgi:hypothetical protein